MKAFHKFQTIVQADCLEYLSEMDAASVDVIVTSPPYNIGTKYSSHKDDMRREDYLQWMEQVCVACKRVMKPDASFFLNVGGSCKDPWIPMDVAQKFREHLVLQNHINWVKSISIGDESYGHFKPINSDAYLNGVWEHLFHFSLDGRRSLDKLAVGVPYQHKSNISRWKRVAVDKRDRGNVWFIPYDTIRSRQIERGGHPATFPELLVERCLKLHGVRPGLVVLDPFLGHGTTLAVTLRMQLIGIGIEKDPEYWLYSCKRLKQE